MAPPGPRTARAASTTEHLTQIEDLLPVVSLLLEIHLNRRIAIDLLDTYVGRDAGERILNGQITRGSGETVQAAIWYCDLRGFTALSERLGRDALLACLNDYFDCMGVPIERHRGEILKFIGDAILAIFRLDDEPACGRALDAAIDARSAMLELNRRRRADGLDALDFGLALHAGEVMYGNIGTADRLDFTVIGPAVNLTTRIERLCRTLGPNLLMSEAFAEMCSASAALARPASPDRRAAAGRDLHARRGRMTPLQRLARRLGYDLTARAKARPVQAQLIAVLERFGVSAVLDVGANAGQYGTALREWGYAGRIVSFEPLAEAHRRLERRAAADPAWRVAPRMALGDRDGEVEIEVSAESDMSSLLPQTDLLRRISPSSRVVGRETVPIRRLDGVVNDYVEADDGMFLKIDTQGFEAQVLAGARRLLAELRGRAGRDVAGPLL